MLDYAEKLTREPWTVTAEDIEYLRRRGFSDTDILDMAQVAAYFAYVNRIADGLGVELEANRRRPPSGEELPPAPERS
jgi:uncharacterized peroxidase-related enzyme